ncbi:MAG: type II toxin-antitoxin system VapC family toxin [Desulfobacteraceae bacterium]|nr:type II toxin-antitoxin system VapC family toxin [Desulfobacteraceae bacterium]
MNLLLDTHILLWSFFEPEKLPGKIKEAMENDSNTLWLSPITIWEILVLHSKRQIELKTDDPVKWIKGKLKSLPFKEAPLNHEVAIKSRTLELPQQDPADRFLMATAIVYDLSFVTADRQMLKNDEHGICFQY